MRGEKRPRPEAPPAAGAGEERGGGEGLVQCSLCRKWRRVPEGAVLPAQTEGWLCEHATWVMVSGSKLSSIACHVRVDAAGEARGEPAARPPPGSGDPWAGFETPTPQGVPVEEDAPEVGARPALKPPFSHPCFPLGPSLLSSEVPNHFPSALPGRSRGWQALGTGVPHLGSRGRGGGGGRRRWRPRCRLWGMNGVRPFPRSLTCLLIVFDRRSIQRGEYYPPSAVV